jgi:hypothetical protein
MNIMHPLPNMKNTCFFNASLQSLIAVSGGFSEFWRNIDLNIITDEEWQRGFRNDNAFYRGEHIEKPIPVTELVKFKKTITNTVAFINAFINFKNNYTSFTPGNTETFLFPLLVAFVEYNKSGSGKVVFGMQEDAAKFIDSLFKALDTIQTAFPEIATSSVFTFVDRFKLLCLVDIACNKCKNVETVYVKEGIISKYLVPIVSPGREHRGMVDGVSVRGGPQTIEDLMNYSLSSRALYDESQSLEREYGITDYVRECLEPRCYNVLIKVVLDDKTGDFSHVEGPPQTARLANYRIEKYRKSMESDLLMVEIPQGEEGKRQEILLDNLPKANGNAPDTSFCGYRWRYRCIIRGGRRVGSSHYIAYVRPHFDPNQWWYCDDATVKRVDEFQGGGLNFRLFIFENMGRDLSWNWAEQSRKYLGWKQKLRDLNKSLRSKREPARTGPSAEEIRQQAEMLAEFNRLKAEQDARLAWHSMQTIFGIMPDYLQPLKENIKEIILEALGKGKNSDDIAGAFLDNNWEFTQVRKILGISDKPFKLRSSLSPPRSPDLPPPDTIRSPPDGSPGRKQVSWGGVDVSEADQRKRDAAAIERHKTREGRGGGMAGFKDDSEGGKTIVPLIGGDIFGSPGQKLGKSPASVVSSSKSPPVINIVSCLILRYNSQVFPQVGQRNFEKQYEMLLVKHNNTTDLAPVSRPYNADVLDSRRAVEKMITELYQTPEEHREPGNISISPNSITCKFSEFGNNIIMNLYIAMVPKQTQEQKKAEKEVWIPIDKYYYGYPQEDWFLTEWVNSDLLKKKLERGFKGCILSKKRELVLELYTVLKNNEDTVGVSNLIYKLQLLGFNSLKGNTPPPRLTGIPSHFEWKEMVESEMKNNQKEGHYIWWIFPTSQRGDHETDPHYKVPQVCGECDGQMWQSWVTDSSFETLVINNVAMTEWNKLCKFIIEAIQRNKFAMDKMDKHKIKAVFPYQDWGRICSFFEEWYPRRAKIPQKYEWVHKLIYYSSQACSTERGRGSKEQFKANKAKATEEFLADMEIYNKEAAEKEQQEALQRFMKKQASQASLSKALLEEEEAQAAQERDEREQKERAAAADASHRAKASEVSSSSSISSESAQWPSTPSRTSSLESGSSDLEWQRAQWGALQLSPIDVVRVLGQDKMDELKKLAELKGWQVVGDEALKLINGIIPTEIHSVDKKTIHPLDEKTKLKWKLYVFVQKKTKESFDKMNSARTRAKSALTKKCTEERRRCTEEIKRGIKKCTEERKKLQKDFKNEEKFKEYINCLYTREKQESAKQLCESMLQLFFEEIENQGISFVENTKEKLQDILSNMITTGIFYGNAIKRWVDGIREDDIKGYMAKNTKLWGLQSHKDELVINLRPRIEYVIKVIKAGKKSDDSAKTCRRCDPSSCWLALTPEEEAKRSYDRLDTNAKRSYDRLEKEAKESENENGIYSQIKDRLDEYMTKK